MPFTFKFYHLPGGMTRGVYAGCQKVDFVTRPTLARQDAPCPGQGRSERSRLRSMSRLRKQTFAFLALAEPQPFGRLADVFTILLGGGFDDFPEHTRGVGTGRQPERQVQDGALKRPAELIETDSEGPPFTAESTFRTGFRQ